MINRYRYMLLAAVMFCLNIMGNRCFGQDTTAGYRESVFISTDRSLYIAGEDLWFQVTIHSNDAMVLSSTVYIEIANENQATLLQHKFRLRDGRAGSRIPLPAGLQSGGYVVRAYSNYSKNFLPDRYAHALITIIHPERGLTKRPIEKENDPPSYPCHNGLVYAFTNKIKGSLRFENNGNAGYYNLQLNGCQDHDSIRLTCINSLYEYTFSAGMGLDKEKLKLKIPGKSMKPGINYLVVKTLNDELLALGCYYRHPQRFDAVRVNPVKSGYQPREKAQVSFLPNQTIPAGIRFCLSVVRKGLGPALVDTSILYKQLQAAPELLNSVYLQYPFIHTIPGTIVQSALSKHLNRLLNHPHKPAHRLHPQSIEFFPETEPLSLYGQVRNDHEMPLAGQKIFLSVLEQPPQLRITETDEHGRFIIPLHPYYGTADVFTGLEKSPQETEFIIHNDFSGDWYSSGIYAFGTDSSSFDMIQNTILAHQVSIRFNTKPTATPGAVDPLPSIERFGTVTLMKDYISLPTTEEVFKEIIENVRVKKKGEEKQVWVFDEIQNLYYKEPLVLLDNIPIFRSGDIFNINPESLQKIIVINRPYHIGDYTFNGIVSLHTADANLGGIDPPGHSTFFEFQAYRPDAKFIPRQFNQRNLPYFRNVLYWKSGILLQDSFHASFQVPDNESEYRILIKGMDKEGNVYYGYDAIAVF